MDFFSLTDIGLVREKNQDSYMTVFNEYDDFFAVVCDGIGGNKAGEVASGEVIKYLSQIFATSGPFEDELAVRQFLSYHLRKVNEHIYLLGKKEEYKGMGTTITGILFTKSFGNFVINIGDSRVYGFRNDRFFHLSEDHTLVNEMMKSGEITYEESLNHPKRHYLMKAVGIWEQVTPDIVKVPEMDYYLVCSDGLHGYVSDEEILKIVKDKEKTVITKSKELMQSALLKGGYDNITFVLIKR